MASVENRVVRMEFDNAAFQQKIAQTLKSLADLDKALKLDGAHKGLSDISAAANKVNLGPVQTAVQSVSAGFLALSTIAVTALSTITHAAITTGASMLKNLTVQPILEGFREFETNVGSIQTILANTRADNTGLDDVNAALNQLNEYSDKTIYNFGQMARNIGTFTAAGVDLQTSVDSIKGISNLAAISGSSAEQAATAMYQLSQAISTGTLRLIDWNSVVNAGMGGEVFQKALFETGKALGTITDVPINTTFEEWTSAGNSFRDSLQSGWLTSEVLTTTLMGFTGDLTEAQILALGYTKEQAAAILELGRVGVEAATKIRTFSQLLNTVRETIGSGWSRTFQTVIGDFEESSELFTNINNAISGFVNAQADARNELLQGWKDMGGRTLLVQGLSDAFKALGQIITPIKDAFRDIFPPTTAQQLFNITKTFAEFAKSLKPSQDTVENIGRIFRGLFSILDIGWETIKAGVGFLKELIVQVTGLGSGNILEFTADISDFFTSLRDGLREGQAIRDFFDNLKEAIKSPADILNVLKDAISALFSGFDEGAADAASAGIERFGNRMDGLSAVFDRLRDLGDRFRGFMEGVLHVLDQVAEAIGEWFSELGQKLADAMGPGDFDAVLDALNVSLLGGIALLLGKFLSGGINLDLGGGLLSNISESFNRLTGVLEAMQTSIRADALIKIAGAVALLTASVVALSLIDSAALTKALTAMAVGFGELMGSFALLNTLDAGLLDGATFAAIAGGLVIMSTALVILSGAVAILAQLDWSELARGLAAVTTLLGIMVTSAIVLSKNAGPLVLASIGLSGMAIALTILAGAIKLFSLFSWEEMAKGFAAIAAGLVIIGLTSKLMGPEIALIGPGLVAVAIALNIMAGAMKIFGTMDWTEIGKGLAAIAGGLVIIGLATKLMGPELVLIGPGLIAVSIALSILSGVMKVFASMSWGEIARGLVVLGGALIILAVATNAMTGALAGAAAIFIVSSALAILAKVLVEMAKIPFGDLVKALGGIALALGIFGLAALVLQPVIPALLGLGVALTLLGAAFALFGVGALAVAKAFEILAEAGPDAADAFLAALEAIGAAIPTLIRGFAEGIVELIKVFTDAAPVIAEAVGVLLIHLLDTLIQAIPKLKEVGIELIEAFLAVLVEVTPDLIDAGIALILALLQGIRDRIGEITRAVLEIIENFLNAIAANIGRIVDAGANIVIELIRGVSNSLWRVTNAVGDLIATFITAIGNNINKVVTAGADVVIAFIQGVGRNANRVVTAGVDTVINFINGIGANAVRLATAAFDVVITFLNSLANVIRQKTPELQAAGRNIAGAIIDGLTFGLASKAQSVANKAVDVAQGALGAVGNFLGIGSPSKEFIKIGQFIGDGLVVGLNNSVAPVERAATDMASSAVSAFSTVLSDIADQIGQIEEFSPTIVPVLDTTQLQEEAARISGYITDAQALVPNVTFAAAQSIATSPTPGQTTIDTDTAESTGGVKFEQNIYAPEQLSTADIYKNTRNQLTLAKEELGVP